MHSCERALDRSLRCLQHPWSLLSIALLLLNDHVLKALFPSWITGKLSDFAGLFFFPFIVSAILGLLPLKPEKGRQLIGQISIGITGLWFLLLKTLPVANELSNQLASSILERPVSFSLDWTDCLALIVLVPAWRLWNGSALRLNRRLALAPLVVGALASLATSPAEEPDEIVFLEQWGRTAYAFAGNYIDYPYYSLDQGATWARCANDRSCPYERQLAVSPPLPIQVCDPDESTTCFRITGEPEVEISIDAGMNWSTAWEVPRGRRVFMQRNEGLSVPRDLMIVVAPKSILLVAMGPEGVLRHQLPDGPWEQVEVGRSIRKRQSAETLFDALSTIVPELALGLGCALLSVLLGGILIWRAACGPKSGKRVISGWLAITSALTLSSPILVLLGFAVGLRVVLALPLEGWMYELEPFALPVLILSLYAAPFLVLALRLRTLERVLDANRTLRRRWSTRGLAAAAMLTVLVPAPFLLWALAIIHSYVTAQIVAFGATGLILYVGYAPLLRTPRPSG